MDGRAFFFAEIRSPLVMEPVAKTAAYPETAKSSYPVLNKADRVFLLTPSSEYFPC
jgi:hypothetical protein